MEAFIAAPSATGIQRAFTSSSTFRLWPSCEAMQAGLMSFLAATVAKVWRVAQAVEDLQAYVLGWKAYLCLAPNVTVRREMREWLHHRLRALQLKHTQAGHEHLARIAPPRGVRPGCCAGGAVYARRWGHNSAMPVAYFDRLGVPRFS